ncbi:malate synthase G [Mesorhizobium loti]|nr:malate synthase G [Mesorhizobium loti]
MSTSDTVLIELCVEKSLGMPRNATKMGTMDTEHRTTVNLKEAIRTAVAMPPS